MTSFYSVKSFYLRLWVRKSGLLATAALILSPFLPAQNWPSFRGPDGSGIGAGNPPVRWNVSTGDNILWKTPVPGLSHSSPVVWGSRVFVATAVEVTPGSADVKTGWLNGTGESAADKGTWSWKLFCLDRDTGRILWERTARTGVPRIRRHRKATHANSTPATDGKWVVASFGAEGLYCYDMQGKEIWRRDLGTFQTGPHNDTSLEWGYASSPIIYRDRVIVQCDATNVSFWASFDLASGKEIRRVMRGEQTTTWSTPLVVEYKGRPQLVCNGWKQMAGYDLYTGEKLWFLHDGGDCPVPAPQWGHGLIYITNGHGKSPVFAVRPEARGDLTPANSESVPAGLAWWVPRGGSYMPTPLVLGDLFVVAGDNGMITAWDAVSGKEVRKEPLKNAGTFSASLVAARDHCYFPNEEGDVHVLRIGRQGFEVLARNPMGEFCFATPAVSGEKLLVRTRHHLFCIGSR